jgi:hypothetical protein
VKEFRVDIQVCINITLYSISWQACMLYIAEIAPKGRRGLMIAMANAIGGTGLVVSCDGRLHSNFQYTVYYTE